MSSRVCAFSAVWPCGQVNASEFIVVLIPNGAMLSHEIVEGVGIIVNII